MSIEHTARTGADKGYYMYVVDDCCSTMNADWHNASINFALQNVSTVTNSGEVDRGARLVKTRAAVFFEAGRPFEVHELDLDEPRAGEVLVRMAAVGICGTDLHSVKGEWVRPTPTVLGHEGAGIVEAVGQGVTGLREGDEVVLSWAPSCGDCDDCSRGRPAPMPRAQPRDRSEHPAGRDDGALAGRRDDLPRHRDRRALGAHRRLGEGGAPRSARACRSSRPRCSAVPR